MSNCDTCRGTGWYGDHCAGIKGNGEYCRCECSVTDGDAIVYEKQVWLEYDNAIAAKDAEIARLREALDDLVAWTGTAKDADDWLAKARAAKKALEPRQDG